MVRRGDHRRAVLAGLTVVALGAIGALFAATAPAGIDSSCSAANDEAAFYFTDPISKERISAAYDDQGGVGDRISGTYKGRSGGMAVADHVTCNNADAHWESLRLQLGDSDQSARLDARKPHSAEPGVNDPIPAYVSVTIYAAGGNDVLLGHKGVDQMYGERGVDVIKIAGGGLDAAYCGGGAHDKAIVSGPDYVSQTCETVIER